MATFNSIDEWSKYIQRRIEQKLMDDAYKKAVIFTIGKMGSRIFEMGQKSSGGSIGRYSTRNPLYVSNQNSPRNGTLRGKTGQRKFKNGNTHKTTYYPNYKSFREAMGRETGFVNLRLSGRLYRNFLNSVYTGLPEASKKAVGKAPVLPAMLGKLDYAITLNPENMAKAKGMELKYGKIFNLTAREKIDFRNMVKFEMIKALTR